MRKLESDTGELFETSVSVLCPQCKNPMSTGFSQFVINICKQNPKTYILLPCGLCNETFYYFPSTGELLLDDAQCQKNNFAILGESR